MPLIHFAVYILNTTSLPYALSPWQHSDCLQLWEQQSEQNVLLSFLSPVPSLTLSLSILCFLCLSSLRSVSLLFLSFIHPCTLSSSPLWLSSALFPLVKVQSGAVTTSAALWPCALCAHGSGRGREGGRVSPKSRWNKGKEPLCSTMEITNVFARKNGRHVSEDF